MPEEEGIDDAGGTSYRSNQPSGIVTIDDSESRIRESWSQIKNYDRHFLQYSVYSFVIKPLHFNSRLNTTHS